MQNTVLQTSQIARDAAVSGADWSLILAGIALVVCIFGYVGSAIWLFSRHNTMMAVLEDRFREMRDDWKEELGAVREELRAGLGGMRDELVAESKEIHRLGERTAALQGDAEALADIRRRLGRLEERPR